MFTVLMRDWKEPLDVRELSAAMAMVWEPGSQNLPSFTDADSGGDDYVIVVSSEPLSPREAQAALDAFLWDEDCDEGPNPHPEGWSMDQALPDSVIADFLHR